MYDLMVVLLAVANRRLRDGTGFLGSVSCFACGLTQLSLGGYVRKVHLLLIWQILLFYADLRAEKCSPSIYATARKRINTRNRVPIVAKCVAAVVFQQRSCHISGDDSGGLVAYAMNI